MRNFLLAAVALMAMGGAAMADNLIGDWRTAPDDNGNTGIIRITQCGQSLCGTLVQAFDASGAVMQSENVGRQIVWDTNPTGEAGQYRGMLYSPDRGREYRSRLQLSGNQLSVSGCVMGGAVCREGGVWQRQN
ncbi:DUF2147 domain-containing protein [Roseicyclus persicicus]|uniref:DUF2147 domain-containing protein n=1 Tax=Roseicyclus persicicus TaxID=2650661 RepID=A0A7X6GYY4_9RHOB|nr:DUF2147 domain-containing protein [Roseibacterium persicicum]NKX43826.1 DUF2147 domain-containing protein [Roseibacterium persicicum]